MDFPPHTQRPHSLSFYLERNPPNGLYGIRKVSSQALSSMARRLHKMVLDYDTRYESKLVIQHPDYTIQRMDEDTISQNLDVLAAQPHTTPRVRFSLTHAQDKDNWLAIERDAITAHRVSYFAQGLDKRLEQLVRRRFEKTRNGYTLIPRT